MEITSHIAHDNIIIYRSYVLFVFFFFYIYMSHLVKFEMNLLEEKDKKKMHAHALFSRRFVVGSSSSSQLTKSLMKKKKLAFSHLSQSRHILSHLLPSSGLASSSSSVGLRSEKIDGFFANTLRRNTHLKLKPGSMLEARARFFDPQLLPKPWVFTGFQKRGWYIFVSYLLYVSYTN